MSVNTYYFAGTISQIADGDRTWTNLEDVNLYQSPGAGGYGNNDLGGVTTANLGSGEITNNIVATGFNAVKWPGASLTSCTLSIEKDTSPGDHADTPNIVDYEVFLTSNGTIISNNLTDVFQQNDWSFGNGGYSIQPIYWDDIFLEGYGEDDLYGSGFGVRFNVTNTKVGGSSIKPLLYQVYLSFTRSSEYPHFIYDGDSTGEVYITLDKNPAVTNPTTTFSIFHGISNTSAPNSNPYGYQFGTETFGWITTPTVNDPTVPGTFNPAGYSYPSNYYNFSTLNFGYYPSPNSSNNYLQYNLPTNSAIHTKTFVWTGVTAPTLYSISDHIMNYNLNLLEAGNTYRRGLLLVNLETPNAGGFPFPQRDFDILYFNIEVIDSRVYPHFLYDGDSTSEVYIELPLSDTTSQSVFQIYHGDDDTTSAGSDMGYLWGNTFTAPVVGDPSVGYTPLSGVTGHGSYDTNYLIAPEGSSSDSTSYCCHNITDHTMSYDTSGLVVGETYRRGFDLLNLRSSSNSKLYDTLYFNIEIIAEPSQLPHFIYNGDTTSEVSVTLTKKVGETNPTTEFLIHHGSDAELLAEYPDLILTYKTYTMYTEEESEFPDSIYTYDSSSSGIGSGIGVYPNNFLNTTPVSIVRGVSGLWGSNTDTTHTMSYDVSSLVSGNSYRRGHVLLYEVTDSSGVIHDFGVYDTLFFNVEVVDTTIPPYIPPYFIYNGFTNTEVTITLDKNPAITNPTTVFSIFHGDIDSSGCLGYSFGTMYTTPNINDPDGGYVDFTGSAEQFGEYTTNYLSTPLIEGLDEVLARNYTLYSSTDHIMTYDTSSLEVGETYRRGLVLVHSHADPDDYESHDILYFNIEVIDSTPAPLAYPHYIYSENPYQEVEDPDDEGPDVPDPPLIYVGDSTSEIFVTMYPTDTTTIVFGVKHDGPSLPPSPTTMVDIFSYSYNIAMDPTDDSLILPSWTSADPTREVESGIYDNRPIDIVYGSGDLELIELTISPYELGGVELDPGEYRIYLTMFLSGYTYEIEPTDLVPDETNVFYETDRLYINITILEPDTKLFRHTGTYSNSIV